MMELSPKTMPSYFMDFLDFMDLMDLAKLSWPDLARPRALASNVLKIIAVGHRFESNPASATPVNTTISRL